MPEGDKSPTACLACALYGSNPGCESVRRVTLGAGSSRQKLLRPLPVTFHSEVSFIFRGGANHHDRWQTQACCKSRISTSITAAAILRGLSFEVPVGKGTTLLGRNIGKTTLLKSLMGLVPVAKGSISFEGAEITKAP